MKVWETIKKDPLVKTIVVILIGVLAFGFAFNIMFGAGSTSMDDGSMMSTGYSLSNTLENIIEILIKVTIIGLLLGVIVWIFRTIKKQPGIGQTERYVWMKGDPIIRNALIIIGAVVVIVFGFSFIRGITSSGSSNEMMNSGTSNSMTYTTFNFTSMFAFLLKVLILVFIIILGYVVIMYFKQNYKNITISEESDVSSINAKDCPECKSKVKGNWKCCPYCGSDKAFKNTTIQE